MTILAPKGENLDSFNHILQPSSLSSHALLCLVNEAQAGMNRGAYF